MNATRLPTNVALTLFLVALAAPNAGAAGRTADGGCSGMETFRVRTAKDEAQCRADGGILVDKTKGNRIPKCENEQGEKMLAKCCCHGG